MPEALFPNEEIGTQEVTGSPGFVSLLCPGASDLTSGPVPVAFSVPYMWH